MGNAFVCYIVLLTNNDGIVPEGSDTACQELLNPAVASPIPPTPAPQLDIVETVSDRDADELFSLDKLSIFKLTLPRGRFEQLQQDALLEEYVDATLQYNDEPVGEVGLRFKGSSGSLYNCFDGNGNQICDKLSMKIKFNEVDKNLRFFGLKKLNFHSMKQDKSKIAETISYKVFRDAGIAAPRSSWARLEVNGEELGLFSLVEQIDGRFTKDRFEEGNGDLYKEAWPRKEDSSYYDGFIKTNKEEATHDRISRFAQDMQSASPGDRLRTLEQWTSLPEMYTFMAVQDAVAQWDGVTAWYCFNGGISSCSNHNFYWYSQETSDHFTLIPWDMDSTMLPANALDVIPHWTQTSDIDCTEGYSLWEETALARAPSCDPILNGLASDMNQYTKAVDEILQDAFDIESIAKDIKVYTAFIENEVERDKFGGSFDAWSREVKRVEDGLPLLKLRLEGYRDGTPWNGSTIGLAQDSTNTFEGAGSLEVALGSGLNSNADTSARVSANRNNAISGSSDIRLDFDFRDGSTGWSHWLAITLPMIDEQVVNLRSKSGVRVKLLSDRFRELRIDVESSENSGASDGVKLGWMASSDNRVASLELYFADLALPEWAQDNGYPADDPRDIQRTVSGLTFSPSPSGRNGGLLGENVVDTGFLQIDDVEFF